MPTIATHTHSLARSLTHCFSSLLFSSCTMASWGSSSPSLSSLCLAGWQPLVLSLLTHGSQRLRSVEIRLASGRSTYMKYAQGQRAGFVHSILRHHTASPPLNCCLDNIFAYTSKYTSLRPSLDTHTQGRARRTAAEAACEFSRCQRQGQQPSLGLACKSRALLHSSAAHF